MGNDPRKSSRSVLTSPRCPRVCRGGSLIFQVKRRVLSGIAGLPASSFSKVFNYLAQALRSILPIHLDGSFGCIGVTALDTINDGQMLVYGKIQTVNDGTCVETPVPLRLRLDSTVDGAETRTRASVDDGLVKADVEVKHVVWLCPPSFGALLKLLVEFS